jgi:hypothetical protein
MGRHMGEFGSAPLAKLLSDPLQSAGLNIIHAYEVTAVLTIYTSGHLLVRDSLPEWEGKDTRALFIFGLDLVLDGARARIGSRISPLE